MSCTLPCYEVLRRISVSSIPRCERAPWYRAKALSLQDITLIHRNNQRVLSRAMPPPVPLSLALSDSWDSSACAASSCFTSHSHRELHNNPRKSNIGGAIVVFSASDILPWPRRCCPPSQPPAVQFLIIVGNLDGDALALLVLLWGVGDGQSCISISSVPHRSLASPSGVQRRARVYVQGGRDCLSLSAFSESLRTRV